MKKRGYHHGDLQTALIDAGLELLRTRDAADLALREVARAVGVSATAVYRHFPDKGALLAALATEGLARLAADQRRASETAGGGVAGFGATGAAYVRFARDNPALFRLIFSGGKPATGEPDDAYTFLRENAAAAAGQGADATVVAIQAWSLAHGLAMLMLDGQVSVDDPMIDRIIDAALVTRR